MSLYLIGLSFFILRIPSLYLIIAGYKFGILSLHLAIVLFFRHLTGPHARAKFWGRKSEMWDINVQFWGEKNSFWYYYSVVETSFHTNQFDCQLSSQLLSTTRSLFLVDWSKPVHLNSVNLFYSLIIFAVLCANCIRQSEQTEVVLKNAFYIQYFNKRFKLKLQQLIYNDSQQ